MKHLSGLAFLVLLIQYTSVCQVVADSGFGNSETETFYQLPGIDQVNAYSDSLKAVYKKKLLTVYTFSVFNEIVPEIQLQVSVDEENILEYTTDNKGRFFIIPGDEPIKKIHFQCTDSNYHLLDTIVLLESFEPEPVYLWLQPKNKLNLRCKVYAGTMPIEDVNSKIICSGKTYNNKTLGCYTDNEQYWNCLYLGMFRQQVVFENPGDSLRIEFSKEGYQNQVIQMKCNDYDGSIISVKLKYSEQLTFTPKHNFSLKATLPVFDSWLFALGYSHLLNIGDFNRIGIGFEGGMVVSTITSELPTFPDIQNSTDSSYIVETSDTSYTSGFIGPKVTIWLNNPLNRKFGMYAGISAPYFLSQKEFHLHPFIGTRIYLDLNKALFVEAKYISYKLDVLEYSFNPYGNASSNTINQSINKLLINLGLLVSF
ncbi:MAG: hypothetical protein JXA77_02235 [Bacteroidales bacterium]|nr:hypothetical protein [Bacteroidales bacterium]MBN2817740.1 hypothetical protein [Bacteroidales bacterium]